MKLYIIGNGFDLHHGIDTKYTSFGIFLKDTQREVYDLFLEHYGFESLCLADLSADSNPLWSHFEENLSELDMDSVLEANIDAMPNYSSEGFRDRDRYTFNIEMERALKMLTTDLYAAFRKFILSVYFPPLDESKAVTLDKNSIYITFNYTDTLSNYYHIPDENILFLHGKAEGCESELILGHGIDPKNFEDKPIVPPEGLSDEDYDRWMEYQSEQYDYSFELGKNTIREYFSKTFKATDEIIHKNEGFFTSLNSVDEIYVLGHSLSDVDLPYFYEIKNSIKQNAKWVVTYYRAEERNKGVEIMKSMGIEHFSIVRIEDI